MKKVEKKILDALSFHEWKRTKHLHEETKVGYGAIYLALDKFEREGWVSRRWADLNAEELRVRGGRGAHEYRLTVGGITRRQEEETTAGYAGRLAHEA